MGGFLYYFGIGCAELAEAGADLHSVPSRPLGCGLFWQTEQYRL